MNTYYLGLDLNLPQNIKILKVKKELGFSGFGLYVEILLKLAQSPSYELAITDYELLAYEFRLDTKYIKSLVENYDLFVIENGKFYCQDVKTKMNKLEEKKEAGRVAGLASGEARKKKMNGRSTSVQTVVEQEKERKGNKEKEINKVNNTPSLDGLNEQVKDLFLSWLENRKKLKKPATDEATRLAIKKLNSFSLDVQKQMLETSILSGWTDFYPPKQTFNSSNSQPTTNNHNQVSKFQALEETREAFDKRIDKLEEERGERFKRVYTEPNKPLPFPKPEFKNI
jgi:hypothetical protein